VRYAILITVLVCGACVALKDYAGRSERAGAGPRPPTLMQSAVTQAELDAMCAARAAALQQEQRQRQPQTPPQPASPTQTSAAQTTQTDAMFADGAPVGVCDSDHGASWGQ
jgi:hypothetical protein